MFRINYLVDITIHPAMLPLNIQTFEFNYDVLHKKGIMVDLILKNSL